MALDSKQRFPGRRCGSLALRVCFRISGVISALDESERRDEHDIGCYRPARWVFIAVVLPDEEIGL